MLRVALALLVVASVSCKPKDQPPPTVSPPTLAEAEAFAKQFAASMSPCDVSALDRAIDYDKFVARATAGRRFSSRQVEEFRRGAKTALGTSMCQELQASSYTYLRTQLVDGAPRPIFRVLTEDSGFNYHQLELDKQGGVVKVVDFYLFASGENMSETFRNLIGALVENANLTTGYLLDKIKQLRAAGEDAKAREMLHGLPAEVRKTKPAMLFEVILASENIESPDYLAAVDAYSKAFPNDPSLDLVQFDSAYVRKDYDAVLASCDRLDKRVGGDAYLDVMRAGVYAETGKLAESIAAAKRATEKEPALETAWWQLLTQQAAAQDYAAAVATIDVLVAKFAAEIDQEGLAADERFTGLAASKELAAWSAARQSPPE